METDKRAFMLIRPDENSSMYGEKLNPGQRVRLTQTFSFVFKDLLFPQTPPFIQAM